MCLLRFILCSHIYHSKCIQEWALKKKICPLCDYSFERLKLHQLYANVAEENLKSQKLFRNMNFQQIGIKKDWNLVNGNYKNEILYQLINNVY